MPKSLGAKLEFPLVNLVRFDPIKHRGQTFQSSYLGTNQIRFITRGHAQERDQLRDSLIHSVSLR